MIQAFLSLFNDGNEFKWFLTTTAVALIGLILFYINPNAQFKVRFFRPWVIVGGIFLVISSYGEGFTLAEIIFPIAPMITLATFFVVKFGRICGNCGRLNQKFRQDKLICRNCGQEIIE